MEVVFRAEAAEDVVLAHSWYEGEQPGLGEEFVEELERLIDLIREMPEAFPSVRQSARRGLFNRFPYALYYRRRTDDVVEILACLHMRQSDVRLKDRG